MTQYEELKKRIGEIIRSVRFPVEAGKVAEFARAMRDESLEFRSIEVAKEKGFDGIPAPLTFSAASAHYSSGDATELTKKLGLDLPRTVHGQHRWSYKRPVIAGDDLIGVTRLAQVESKPNRDGNETLQVTLDTEYKAQSGETVLVEQMVILQLPARVNR